jgi:catecholate siderophore receptor
MHCLLFVAALALMPFSMPSEDREPAQVSIPQVQLDGYVRDPAGGVLDGAQITAASEGTGASRTSATTDRTGHFVLVLDPGTYDLTIAAAGFLDAVQRLTLPKGSAQKREFVLQLAGVRQDVSVSAPSGYQVEAVTTATKTLTALRDVPQAVTVITRELVADQMMTSVGDVVRYVPGITAHQGENNRDQIVVRGNSSSADFFVNGVRDDVQYYRDLYNLERVEALKGPNAMIFGRGGGGGIVNRVTKEALFRPERELTIQGGGYGHKRVTTDVAQPLSGALAVRVNGMLEDSGSFRDAVTLRRAAVNPTLTYAPNGRTRVTFGYEYLRDTRVADRGITSFQGRPAAVPISTFYGNPADSYVRARVNLGSAAIEHRAGRVTFRNRTLIGGYDRSYQNFVPGAASPDQSLVSLSAYNNATRRLNVFNQSDLSFAASTGRIRHVVLAGVEIGRQQTDNFRQSGFFGAGTSAIQVPFSSPTIDTPVTFRQSATDADNHVRTKVGAAFLQDQAELSSHFQVIAGLRLDRFDLEYHNNRNGDTLARTDSLVSPRLGLVFKPIARVSLYSTYSVSYLPSSGDQFSSLTAVTQQVKPEQFNNYEAGLKWDALPALAVTAAVYRLDRTNTRSTDPNDPVRIVQTGGQRTNGYEIGISGQLTPAWRVAGGYAWQDAFVTSATIAARAGAQVGQVPHHTFSLWNHYRLHPRLGVGAGVVHRSDMFAGIDNTVTLPRYTDVDAAAYFTLRPNLRLQVNAENLFDTRYFVNADSNTNISPGSPRTLRVGITTRF